MGPPSDDGGPLTLPVCEGARVLVGLTLRLGETKGLERWAGFRSCVTMQGDGLQCEVGCRTCTHASSCVRFSCDEEAPWRDV